MDVRYRENFTFTPKTKMILFRLLRKRTAFEMFSDNAAPPGFGYLTRRNPLSKRIFWFVVLVVGLIYPTYNFQKQFKKYRRYGPES